MADTIFTRIIEGDIPCHKVYEDEHSFAFLDINPLSRGHTLFVPKRAVARLEDLPPDVAMHHLATLPRLVGAVTRGVGADGATVAWNNGEAAGQEVAHVHCHIVPRWDGDGHGPIHALFKGHAEKEDLEDVAKRIGEHLGSD